MNDENRVIAEHKNTPYIVGPELCLQMLYYYGCIAGNLSTVAARRASLEQAGRFDESFRVAGDYEMWVRLCQFGKVAERCDKLIRLRQHPAQLSKSKDVGIQFIYECRRIRVSYPSTSPERHPAQGLKICLLAARRPRRALFRPLLDGSRFCHVFAPD